ncbi:putative disease resistance protein [Abeliophyllum distichum]|uniref:Disease resistance protein n=1 Tax=Abeliophyllum distichum TaxID=126358 RepID=A0ABD1TG11_9LAMI
MEVTQFLRSKFLTLLEEAENDPGRLSVLSRFRSTARLINFTCENMSFMSNDTAWKIRDELYNLIDELSKCRIFAHKWRKAVTTKGLFHLMKTLAEFWLTRGTRRKLKQIEDVFKNIDTNLDTNQRDSSPRNLVQQTYPIIDASRIIGFDSAATQIEKLLIQQDSGKDTDGFATIGIVGGSGSGKTALAQKVFASQIVKQTFYPRIWVCLSNILFDERVDLRARVLKYMLEELGHDISELEYADFSIVTLLEKLQRKLMGKRYLIVLDDAWKLIEWYSDLGYRLPRGYAIGNCFSHGLPKGSGGGIIVTSRRENAAREMVGAKNLIHIEPHLSDEICWKIFTDVVRRGRKIDLNDAYFDENEE